MDQFGDHFLGYGHGPMRICWHDALCDILFFMLSFKIIVVVRGNSTVAVIWITQGMFITLNFCMISLFTLMLLCVAASQGEVEKDAHHNEAVLGA